jgi:hypothetical protein
MKKFVNYITLSVILLLFALLLFPPAAKADYLDPYTYQDTATFDPSHLYTAVADWWQHIPGDFNPDTATICLELRVAHYSEIGVLDLFASNTSDFDYVSPYIASSKPGFIARLYSLVPPIFVDPAVQTVCLTLDPDQVDWLGDDGNIHLALIGNQYVFPTGFPATFYLSSATLTASVDHVVVPIPGAFWLLGPGLVGLLGLRGFRRS